MTEDLSPRAALRTRVEMYAEEHPGLAAPDLARDFVASLTPEDLPLIREYLVGDVVGIVAGVMRASYARTRNGIFASLDVSTSKVPLREAKKLESVYERITLWREYSPDIGDKQLFDMTRREVRSAWEFRSRNLESILWRTETLRRIEAQMLGEDQKVGDRFTAEDVARLVQTIRGEMYSGTFRLKIAPIRPLSRKAAISGPTDGRDAEGSEVDRGLVALKGGDH